MNTVPRRDPWIMEGPEHWPVAAGNAREMSQAEKRASMKELEMNDVCLLKVRLPDEGEAEQREIRL